MPTCAEPTRAVSRAAQAGLLKAAACAGATTFFGTSTDQEVTHEAFHARRLWSGAAAGAAPWKGQEPWGRSTFAMKGRDVNHACKSDISSEQAVQEDEEDCEPWWH